MTIPRDIEDVNFPRVIEDVNFPRVIEDVNFPRDIEDVNLPRVTEEANLPRHPQAEGRGGPQPSNDVFNDIRALLTQRVEQAQRGELVHASVTEIVAQVLIFSKDTAEIGP